MKIKIISWNGNVISKEDEDDEVDFFLEQDSWNDFGYYTYYFLHSKFGNDSNTFKPIGGVRILKKGQEEKQKYLLELGIIDKLPEEYCSLGSSLDYYERIAQLDSSIKSQLLNSLNDIINNPSLLQIFKDEEGFNKSILRDITLHDDIFILAPTLLTGNYETLPDIKDLKFSFQTNEMSQPITFDFSSKEYGFARESLPSRISVVVGRNGSGKSTLLSKIARLVFSSTEDRKYIVEMGKLEPKGIGFPRIINISYSAFDSFQVPGITIAEKKQILVEMEKNVGRYIYCGVRDINMEVENELKSLRINSYGRIELEDILNDKYEFNYLKPLTVIKDEFLFALKKIQEDYKKVYLFETCLQLLSEEPSLNFLKDIRREKFYLLRETLFFNNLSTGHKFVIHSVTKLIYHIEKRCLVLFDEPESHLHPPLLAVLMKVLRNIMEYQKSFMIITTHSPVVLQETLKKHVIIVRREEDNIKTFEPISQTYGENLNSITNDIFGLSTDYTDYHTELDKIINSFYGSDEAFEKYILDLFDGKISMQGYAYLMSSYKSK